jgi:hypothetical protein
MVNSSHSQDAHYHHRVRVVLRPLYSGGEGVLCHCDSAPVTLISSVFATVTNCDCGNDNLNHLARQTTNVQCFAMRPQAANITIGSRRQANDLREHLIETVTNTIAEDYSLSKAKSFRPTNQTASETTVEMELRKRPCMHGLDRSAAPHNEHRANEPSGCHERFNEVDGSRGSRAQCGKIDVSLADSGPDSRWFRVDTISGPLLFGIEAGTNEADNDSRLFVAWPMLYQIRSGGQTPIGGVILSYLRAPFSRITSAHMDA